MSTIAQPTRAGRVALVGRPNVGKSTLLNALLGQAIAITSSHPQTTRTAIRGVLTTTDAQYVFVDTPGLHAPRTRLGRWMNDVARQAVREADAVAFVVEAPRDGESALPSGADRGRATRPRDADLALGSELPHSRTVLVVSKIDRLKDKGLMLPFLSAFTAAHAFAAVVLLSAKRADGVDTLLDELRPLLPEQPFPYESDTLSDQPERFFVAELVREQILQHTRQEVPHGVAVVVERFDDASDPLRIEISIHVPRDAHKRIVIGAGGQMLKTIGTAARTRVEQLLGKHVRLELWVKITPDWMDDEARLRELGYGPDQ